MAEDKTKSKGKEVENTKPTDEAAKGTKVEEQSKTEEQSKSTKTASHQGDKPHVTPPAEEEIAQESPIEPVKPLVSKFDKALARRRGTRLQSTFHEVKAERQGVPNKGLTFEELKELRR